MTEIEEGDGDVVEADETYIGKKEEPRVSPQRRGKPYIRGGKSGGRMKRTFPHQIGVTSIDTFPPEDELPDWDDLRGLAPGATGDLSSEAFVRELRDAWQ